MTKIFLKMAIAGGVAFAVMGPLNAAPVSQAERGDFQLTERHEFRDAQTGDYRPHGTLSTKANSPAPKYTDASPEVKVPSGMFSPRQFSNCHRPLPRF